MRLGRYAPLWLLVLTGLLACSAGPGPEGVGRARGGLKVPVVIEDSMSTSGLMQNGLMQNGLMQNGLMQNGLMQNGLMQNGLWQDAFWQQRPAAREILRTNPYARELLRYTYECAMPMGQSTTIDQGVGGANLVLQGGIGLAPQWGEPGGTCDKSCQRWLTACLLARTNAYGEPVAISMRAPDDAPEPIKTALGLVAGEADEYELFEGAFYGNLFEQTLRDGASVMTPHLYACSGAGSNVPEVTRRFNASEGAGGLIEVVGPCLGQPLYPRSACEAIGSGEGAAVKECYPTTSPERQADAVYKEVITVYLKKPRARCGNAVCEAGESSGDLACPSDCPAGWATSLGAVLTQGSASSSQDHRLTIGSWARLSALGPDNSIVLAGVTPAAVEVGAVKLPAVGSGGTAMGVLIKFKPDGAPVWGRRFDVGGRAALVAVAVGPSPDGHRISVVLNERRDEYKSAIRVTSFDPANGDPGGSRVFEESATTSSVSATALAVGPGGDLFIAATLVGSLGFDDATTLEAGDRPREFVLKLSPGGAPLWAARFDRQAYPSLGARAIKVDSAGGAVVALRHGGGGALWKLTPLGATQWWQKGIFGGVAFDPDGDVYATGALEQGPDGPATYGFPWPVGAKIGDFFVVRYNQEGGQAPAPKVVESFCSDPLSPCAYRWFTGREIAFADTGELLVGVRGGSRSTIDLGGGPFRAYATDDLFVAAFSKADLEPLWAKHLPMALDGTLRGMHFGGTGDQRRVVVSGTFSGSTVVNGRALASPAPEQRGVGSTFVASFALPPADDPTPPVIVDDSLPEAPAFADVEATSAAGARVFFVPPLSMDAGNDGVTVTCTPPPNSVFPIGSMQVKCVSTDPVGNQTPPQTFYVQVVDKGPGFVETPEPVVAEAAAEGDTPVFFATPEAVDLIDGPLTGVTCTPESGSAFPLGTTQVTCAAKDSKGTTATVTFPVHVRKGGEKCGNGVLDPGEECDDGNTVDGDGCASTCVRVNRPPACASVFASPADILASTGQNFMPITVVGVTDPDGDPVTIEAKKIRQDERVSALWCPGGTCADATLAPLTVRAERDTWAPIDPQPDGRVYHIEFSAKDSQGAECLGKVTVCVRRRHDVLGCGDQGDLYNSLVPTLDP